MKMIFKVARTELRNLFYSPVAWFLILVFVIMCGIFFTGALNTFAIMQDVAIRTMPDFKDFNQSLTETIFLNSGSMIPVVLGNCYLFIPLLTMGLISREINNGTIKLLYSSPVKIRQIVLGKYLAIIVYNLILVGILAVFMFTGARSIQSADTGLLTAAAIGFFLLLCTFAAIGMFMSSLTTYQIVSAIATFVLFFVLSRLGSLWQQYDFFRDLTWFLSIDGRAGKMLSGLVTTREVIYFVMISSMFVIFTILKLKGGRESKPWYKKALRYVSVFLVVMVVGYFSSKPSLIGYWDATARKTNTISPKIQQLLISTGDEPLEVTFYANLLGGGIQRAMPENRNDYVWNFWEKYVRYKSDIKLNYVQYYDVKDDNKYIYQTMPGKTLAEIAGEVAKMKQTNLNWWIGPAQVRKMDDLAPEDMRAVMKVRYKGRTEWLRTFDDPRFWPDQDHVAAVLKNLVEGTGPKVYQINGHLERDIYKRGEREYSTYTLKKNDRRSLINHGFSFDSLDLRKKDVPSDASMLVLGDPKVELDTLTLTRIRKYIDGGGNMFILGEPGKQHVLNPVLQPLGAKLLPGTLVEITKEEMPHMIKPYATHDFSHLIKEMKMKVSEQLLKGDTTRLVHQGVAGVAFTDSIFKARHVLVTSGRNTWAKAGTLVTDSAAPVFVAAEGDYKLDSFNVSLAISRKLGNKEQRIVVTGDADFISNRRHSTQNLGGIYQSWLTNEVYPVQIIYPPKKDALLSIGLATAGFMKIFFIWILPAAILLLGTILLIRRKRK